MTWREAYRRALVAVLALIGWYVVGMVLAGLGSVLFLDVGFRYSSEAVVVVGAIIAVGGVVAIAMDSGDENRRNKYGLPVVVVGLLVTVLGTVLLVTEIRAEIIVGGMLFVLGFGIVILAWLAVMIKILTDAVSASLSANIERILSQRTNMP